MAEQRTSGTAGIAPRLFWRSASKVMAKQLRGRKSEKKLSLKERLVFATWVGIDRQNK